MTHYVAWSGGLDSTLLLKDLSSEFSKDTINAITVTHVGNNPQLKQESKTRNKLHKILPKNIKYHTIRVQTNLHGQGQQMPYWLSFIMPFIGNGDTLNMGYLGSDGYNFWGLKENLINSFNSFMELQSTKDAKIEFPLQYRNKGYVIQALKRLKLLNNCWYCGDPKNGKRCGKCMKCMSFKRWSKYPDEGTNV